MSKSNSNEDRRGMLIGGVICLGVGAIFLLSNLGMLPRMREIWPLFPIVVGIALIVGAFMKKNGKRGSEPEN